MTMTKDASFCGRLSYGNQGLKAVPFLHPNLEQGADFFTGARYRETFDILRGLSHVSMDEGEGGK